MKTLEQNLEVIQNLIVKNLEMYVEPSFSKEQLLELSVETGVMEQFIRNAITSSRSHFIEYSIRMAITNYLKKQKVNVEDVHFNSNRMIVTHKDKSLLKISISGHDYRLLITTAPKKVKKSRYFIKIKNETEFANKTDYNHENELNFIIHFENLTELHDFILTELPNLETCKIWS